MNARERPAPQFENAADLGPDFNDLMLAVSSDKAFLRRVVAKAALYDTFTAQLVQLMDRVDASQSLRPDPVSVMINRSDYMLGASLSSPMGNPQHPAPLPDLSSPAPHPANPPPPPRTQTNPPDACYRSRSI